MKDLISPVVLALLLLTVSSCDKEPDSFSIIGQWEVIKSEVFIYDGDVLVSQETFEADWYKIQFNEDGKCIVYFDRLDPSDTEVLDWTPTGVLFQSGDLLTIDGDELELSSITARTAVLTFWESSTDKIDFTCKKVET